MVDPADPNPDPDYPDPAHPELSALGPAAARGRADNSERPGELSALNPAGAPGRADNSEGPGSESEQARAQAGDPLGVAAIVLGCIGIVTFGLVLCVVTAVVASIAGARARAAGRSLDNAYIGFVLAAVDGVVWIVLHMLFDLTYLAG